MVQPLLTFLQLVVVVVLLLLLQSCLAVTAFSHTVR
jgi:hypothetical protein